MKTFISMLVELGIVDQLVTRIGTRIPGAITLYTRVRTSSSVPGCAATAIGQITGAFKGLRKKCYRCSYAMCGSDLAGLFIQQEMKKISDERGIDATTRRGHDALSVLIMNTIELNNHRPGKDSLWIKQFISIHHYYSIKIVQLNLE